MNIKLFLNSLLIWKVYIVRKSCSLKLYIVSIVMQFKCLEDLKKRLKYLNQPNKWKKMYTVIYKEISRLLPNIAASWIDAVKSTDVWRILAHFSHRVKNVPKSYEEAVCLTVAGLPSSENKRTISVSSINQ